MMPMLYNSLVGILLLGPLYIRMQLHLAVHSVLSLYLYRLIICLRQYYDTMPLHETETFNMLICTL